MCKKWQQIASDDSFWRPLFMDRFGGPGPAARGSDVSDSDSDSDDSPDEGI